MTLLLQEENVSSEDPRDVEVINKGIGLQELQLVLCTKPAIMTYCFFQRLRICIQVALCHLNKDIPSEVANLKKLRSQLIVRQWSHLNKTFSQWGIPTGSL